MRESTTRQTGATLTFEISTVAATAIFVMAAKFLWPEALASQRLIPRGTVLTIQLDSPISSQTAHLGDQFYGHIKSAAGAATILAGARVVGKCVAARGPQFGRAPGYLRLALSGLIDAKGNFAPLYTSTVSFWGDRLLSSGVQTELTGDLPLVRAADVPASPQRSEDAVARPEQQLSFVMLRPVVVAHP